MKKKVNNYEFGFEKEINAVFILNKSRNKCFVGMNSTDYPGEENECDVFMFTDDSDIEGLGFDEDEINTILNLEVGERTDDFAFPGVYVIRLR